MSKNTEGETKKGRYEFEIEIKNRNDILDDIGFKDDFDRRTCEDIISHLEKSVADNVRKDNVANIPFIGCVRYNPVLRKFKNLKLHLRAIRKNISKDEYKDYVRGYIDELRKESIAADNKKLAIRNLKKKYKDKYEQLCLNLGQGYAEMFITTLTWFKEVPFNQEFEDQYNKLKAEEAEDIEAYKEEKVNDDKVVKLKSFSMTDYLAATNNVKFRMKID